MAQGVAAPPTVKPANCASTPRAHVLKPVGGSRCGGLGLGSIGPRNRSRMAPWASTMSVTGSCGDSKRGEEMVTWIPKDRKPPSVLCDEFPCAGLRVVAVHSQDCDPTFVGVTEAAIRGASCWHGGHQDAKKLITIGRPVYVLPRICFPVRVVAWNGGAGLSSWAGRIVCATARGLSAPWCACPYAKTVATTAAARSTLAIVTGRGTPETVPVLIGSRALAQASRGCGSVASSKRDFGRKRKL